MTWTEDILLGEDGEPLDYSRYEPEPQRPPRPAWVWAVGVLLPLLLGLLVARARGATTGVVLALACAGAVEMAWRMLTGRDQ